MKFRLLDLLACPIDKTFPLELIVLDEKKVVGETKEVKTPVFLSGSRKWQQEKSIVTHVTQKKLYREY